MRDRLAALRVAFRRYGTCIDENKVDFFRRGVFFRLFPAVGQKRRAEPLRLVLIDFTA